MLSTIELSRRRCGGGLVPALVLACAVLSAGCGNLVDGEHKGDPLVKLQGQITNSPGKTSPPALRVALVWLAPAPAPSGPDGGTPSPLAFVAQETEIEPEFPAAFTLSVFGLPPTAAMIPADASKVAVAQVVVYEDGNQNQKLDFVAQSAAAAVDRVMASCQHSLQYLEGAPVASPLHAEAKGSLLQPGFNLVDGDGKLVPLDTLVTCALDDRPELMEVLCEGGFLRDNQQQDLGQHEWGTGPSYPKDAAVSCSEDRRTAVINWAAASFPSPCLQRTTSSRLELYLPAGITAPADWICND
jgi:hypothetical protein